MFYLADKTEDFGRRQLRFFRGTAPKSQERSQDIQEFCNKHQKITVNLKKARTPWWSSG